MATYPPKPMISVTERFILEVVEILVSEEVPHKTIGNVIEKLRTLEVPFVGMDAFIDERGANALCRIRTGN